MKDIIKVTNEQTEELLGYRCDEIDIRKKNALMRECISELKDTMRNNHLIALSAPQIGYNCRIFCIQFEKVIKTFINPLLTELNGLELSKETDISIPDKTYIRVRHPKITLMYQTPTGKTESSKLIGAAATLIQREIDYLDGLLLSDVGLEIDDDFESATDEEKQQIINMYLDSIDVQAKKLSEELKNDPDAKQIEDAIDFINSVEKGNTQLSEDVISIPKTDNNSIEDE